MTTVKNKKKNPNIYPPLYIVYIQLKLGDQKVIAVCQRWVQNINIENLENIKCNWNLKWIMSQWFTENKPSFKSLKLLRGSHAERQ